MCGCINLASQVFYRVDSLSLCFTVDNIFFLLNEDYQKLQIVGDLRLRRKSSIKSVHSSGSDWLASVIISLCLIPSLNYSAAAAGKLDD